MLGRIINIVLTPIWLLMVVVILAFALTVRILRGAADIFEIIGGGIADCTKGLIELFQEL
jgi:hypothetical protein